jgi:hypothetical protein
LGERPVGKDFPNRLIMGGTQDIEIGFEGQWKRAGWRCVFRWSSLPNNSVEVGSQELGKHWREHLYIGIECLAPRLGMRHCTGLCPAGGSTGLSCVAYPSAVKHTLDGVQHGVVLEELLDQGTQCFGAGHVVFWRQVVPRGRVSGIQTSAEGSTSGDTGSSVAECPGRVLTF